MDKQTIQKLVSIKSEQVTYVEYAGKSAVWKNCMPVDVDDEAFLKICRGSAVGAVAGNLVTGWDGGRGQTRGCGGG